MKELCSLWKDQFKVVVRCILNHVTLIECPKEAQELHFFTIEIHGKKLVRIINLLARLFLRQFRTIYILRGGFVSLFVIAFVLFCSVSITVVYVVGYSDVCVFRVTLPISVYRLCHYTHASFSNTVELPCATTSSLHHLL